MALLGQYAGKNLKDLPVNQQQMPKGLLNIAYDEATDPNSATSRGARKSLLIDAGTFNRALQGDKEATGQILSQSMNMAGMAPLGMTVWHGSPHKFTKFDMSKIGTGEGAQAYGHGLYMAEAPDVAKEYQRALGRPDSQGLTKAQDIAAWAHSTGVKGNDDAVRVLEDEIARLDSYNKFDGKKLNRNAYMEALAMVKQNAAPTNGSLYKVDIPDEAVARFLDWDKPLSQQAPEVRSALEKYGIGSNKDPELMSDDELLGALGAFENTLGKGEATGKKLYKELADFFGNPATLTEDMRKAGIPGIRYLDGGSRSAGQGSSNFVLFDDQLPRILEINGQATGNVPWQPGEWRGLLNP